MWQVVCGRGQRRGPPRLTEPPLHLGGIWGPSKQKVLDPAQATVPGLPAAPHALSQDGVVQLPEEDSRTPGPPTFGALASSHRGREGTGKPRHTGSSPSHTLEKGECWARGICPPTGGSTVGTRLEMSETDHRCHTACSCPTPQIHMLNP